MLNFKNYAPILSAEEAAGFLNCSARTVARLCSRGELVACRAGNRWRINRDALLRFAGYDPSEFIAGEVSTDER